VASAGSFGRLGFGSGLGDLADGHAFVTDRVEHCAGRSLFDGQPVRLGRSDAVQCWPPSTGGEDSDLAVLVGISRPANRSSTLL